MTTASSENQTVNEKQLTQAEPSRNTDILVDSKKRNASKSLLSSLASVSFHVSIWTLSHVNPIINFSKSLEHQQKMPFTFLASKDLISFSIVPDNRNVGVMQSLILEEKYSLPFLAAADISDVNFVFQKLLGTFQNLIFTFHHHLKIHLSRFPD